jgi:hypothetical protein
LLGEFCTLGDVSIYFVGKRFSKNVVCLLSSRISTLLGKYEEEFSVFFRIFQGYKLWKLIWNVQCGLERIILSNLFLIYFHPSSGK